MELIVRKEERILTYILSPEGLRIMTLAQYLLQDLQSRDQEPPIICPDTSGRFVNYSVDFGVRIPTK